MSEQQGLQTAKYLPTIYRLRDEVQGRPLHALLSVIDEQVALVSENTQQLLDDFFIETCQPQFVPYLGELIGCGASIDVTSQATKLLPIESNKFIFPRREVGQGIALQRRKGTLKAIEDLTEIVTGWVGEASAWYPRVTQFQVPSDPQPELGVLWHARRGAPSTEVDGTLSQGSYFPDARTSSESRARRNAGLIRLKVWRLKSYSHTLATPKCIKTLDCTDIRLLTFDPGGLCRPLAANPGFASASQREKSPRRPEMLSREMVTGKSPAPPRAGVVAHYGRGDSFAIYEAKTRNSFGQPAFDLVPSKRIHVASLASLLTPTTGDSRCGCGDTSLRTSNASTRTRNDTRKAIAWLTRAQDRILIDPECGLIAVRENLLKMEIATSYHYLFTTELGGGEYVRQLPANPPLANQRVIRVGRPKPSEQMSPGGATKTDDLNYWLRHGFDHWIEPTACMDSRLPKHLILELTDSATHVVTCTEPVKVPAECKLEIRAVVGRFPCLELTQSGCEHGLECALGEGAELILRGLRITGAAIRLTANAEEPKKLPKSFYDLCGCAKPAETQPPRATIQHCTLTPGSSCNCRHNPGSVALRSDCDRVFIDIDHCIVSSLQCPAKAEVGALTEAPLGPPPVLQPQAPVTEPTLDSAVSNDPGKPCEPPPQISLQRILVRDSIVDGCQHDAAICGQNVRLRIERATVLGAVNVREIALAQDTIFTRPVDVLRRQVGGMRFCYVPPDRSKPGSRSPQWNTPPQFYCQPSQYLARADKPDLGYRPQLVLTACAYGHPAYGRLHAECVANLDSCHCRSQNKHRPLCSSEIARGAESGSEMGVFHELYQPQRADNLRRRAAEFTPIAMHTQIIFKS